MDKDLNMDAAAAVLHPVTTQRASEAIYEQIKGLIISGQFKPGDRLPSERSLMTMLQRSRPTIREALRMLERAGFIRTMPGTNGAIVQELGTDGVEQSLEVVLQTSKVTMAELVEYRSTNDTAVARWAAQRHTKEDIHLLEQILRDGEALIREGDYASFVHLDSVFHGRLAKAGKNEVAYILTQVISNLVEPWMRQALEEQSPEESLDMCRRIHDMHRRIYEAVRIGDSDAAQAAMTHHIRVFADDLGHQPPDQR